MSGAHVLAKNAGGTESVNQTPLTDKKNMKPSTCILPAST